MSKFARRFIKRLAVLTLLTAVIVTGFNFKTNSKPVQNTNQIEQQQVIKETENLQEKQEVINKAFQDCAKLQVATGTIDMSYTFSNKSSEIMSQSTGNPMKTLHNKLTHRDIKYSTQFQYNYKYDLSNIYTYIDGETLNINILEGSLLLEDVKENKDHAQIEESTGWLASRFSSQETWAISYLCEKKANNYLQTDQDLHQNALNSLTKGIDTLCKNLNIKNYVINIHTSQTISNKDRFTTINHQQQSGSINLCR